jgi:uncharacterized protein
MMSKIFVDTSGWGNLIDVSQPYHGLAADIYRNTKQRSQQFITSNYVLAELVALLESPLRIPRVKTIAFLKSLKASPTVEILHVDPDIDAEAWTLLEARPDKAWSLVDCSSFSIMQQQNITQALTNDHHFEQAGFIRLLK